MPRMVRRENLVLKLGYGLGLKKRGLGVAKKRGEEILIPALQRGVGQGTSRSSKKFVPATPERTLNMSCKSVLTLMEVARFAIDLKAG